MEFPVASNIGLKNPLVFEIIDLFKTSLVFTNTAPRQIPLGHDETLATLKLSPYRPYTSILVLK